MYDEVVNAAKRVLLEHLDLALEDYQSLVVIALSYSRDPDYWQICLGLGLLDTYTVVFQAGRAPKIIRGRA